MANLALQEEDKKELVDGKTYKYYDTLMSSVSPAVGAYGYWTDAAIDMRNVSHVKIFINETVAGTIRFAIRCYDNDFVLQINNRNMTIPFENGFQRSIILTRDFNVFSQSPLFVLGLADLWQHPFIGFGIKAETATPTCTAKISTISN